MKKGSKSRKNSTKTVRFLAKVVSAVFEVPGGGVWAEYRKKVVSETSDRQHLLDVLEERGQNYREYLESEIALEHKIKVYRASTVLRANRELQSIVLRISKSGCHFVTRDCEKRCKIANGC